MHTFSTPTSMSASRRFQRAAEAEQALQDARAIRRPERALCTRNLAAPSVGAHENAHVDAHAPNAGNAGGNIMLMHTEMIWRIHISAFGTHMHATAATRRLTSRTRYVSRRQPPPRTCRREAHRTCTGGAAMDDSQEAWCARARDERAGDGQLGPQQLPGQEAAAHLFGQLVGLLARRSASAAVGVEIEAAPDLHARRARFGRWRSSSSRPTPLSARAMAPTGSKSRHEGPDLCQ